MATTDFTTTLLVDQTPKEVFNAISNVRGWWSEEIEGGTEQLNDEFTYHYKDVHNCKMKLIEVIPGKKIVWLVMDNYFNFIKDQSEWKGTKIIFEISQADTKTQLRFTHEGLVPGYECYGVCKDAWSSYIRNSLHSLITTGEGQPNPKEGELKKVKEQDYHTSITVNATAHEVFKSINNVTQWWTENLEGSSHKLNNEFSVRFGDVHFSKQKIVEIIPDEKVVWLVTDSNLNFVKAKDEWTNTKIVFELVSLGAKFTQVRFTHVGLVPEIECYDGCSGAWSQYIQQSLANLITRGKGQPTKKETKATF